MSRGPGRWQRAILERLETREQFYLAEILPCHTKMQRGRTQQVFLKHERMAALRAAHRLAARGRIALQTRVASSGFDWNYAFPPPRHWSCHTYWTGERWQRLGGAIVARPGVRISLIAQEIAYEVASNMKRDQEWRERRQQWREQRQQTQEISVGISNDDFIPPDVAPKRRAMSGDAFSENPYERRGQLGAVGSAVKLLAAKGPVTDAGVHQFMAKVMMSPSVIQAALDQLKADGTYQRLINEATNPT
jgi:hypothetical protein